MIMANETTGTGQGTRRWVILLIVLVSVVGVFILRANDRQEFSSETAVVSGQTETGPSLPRLLDLGADKCVPCKMMAPILDELETDLADQLEVIFLDVWKNPDLAKKYEIKLIPTQIFFDPDGAELFRHEGFFARDDILAKWEELGYEFRLPSTDRG